MKRLFLLSALAAGVLFSTSCGNNSSAAAAAAAAPSSGDDGNGSLSYTVDGVKTTVKPPATTLYINEVGHNAEKGSVKIKVTIFPAGELFNFIVADKGTTAIEHYRPSFGEEKVKGVFLHLTHNYYADHASITISALDAAHVAGTFSGTFTDEGKTVNITDGSFDLPIRAAR